MTLPSMRRFVLALRFRISISQIGNARHYLCWETEATNRPKVLTMLTKQPSKHYRLDILITTGKPDDVFLPCEPFDTMDIEEIEHIIGATGHDFSQMNEQKNELGVIFYHGNIDLADVKKASARNLSPKCNHHLTHMCKVVVEAEKVFFGREAWCMFVVFDPPNHVSN